MSNKIICKSFLQAFLPNIKINDIKTINTYLDCPKEEEIKDWHVKEVTEIYENLPKVSTNIDVICDIIEGQVLIKIQIIPEKICNEFGFRIKKFLEIEDKLSNINNIDKIIYLNILGEGIGKIEWDNEFENYIIGDNEIYQFPLYLDRENSSIEFSDWMDFIEYGHLKNEDDISNISIQEIKDAHNLIKISNLPLKIKKLNIKQHLTESELHSGYLKAIIGEEINKIRKKVINNMLKNKFETYQVKNLMGINDQEFSESKNFVEDTHVGGNVYQLNIPGHFPEHAKKSMIYQQVTKFEPHSEHIEIVKVHVKEKEVRRLTTSFVGNGLKSNIIKKFFNKIS